MKVLVTGAFGNIGSNSVEALLAKGHTVRALSNDPRRDASLSRRWASRVDIVQGDIRDARLLKALVRDVDVVVHLAFIIPPLALEKPEFARSVNVDGTHALIDAMQTTAPRAKLLFASTLDVYGHTQHLAPPRRVTDPVQPTDVYSQHKIECEAMVRATSLSWCIFRFADVPPIELRQPHPIMFTIPLSQRIEMIHPRDAGLAVANAVSHSDVWGKTLHIGGGARCQLTYGAYLNAFLEAMQIGALPPEWFSQSPYCTDWLDTEESESMLRYQRHTFEDVVRETAALLGWKAPLARAFRPVVRWQLSRMSKRVLGK